MSEVRTLRPSAEEKRVEPIEPIEPVPVPGVESPPPEPETPKRPRRRRRGRRLALMLVVPLLIAATGGYFWLFSGRYESTDNAYVQQAKVAISADVPGRIVSVSVAENRPVKRGDTLFAIDPKPYRIALEEAQAAVASARLKVEQLRAAYRTAQAQLQSAERTAAIRRDDYQRQQALKMGGFTPQSQLDQSRLALEDAEEKVSVAEQNVESARAALGNAPDLPTDQHPSVKEALSRVEKAALDLDRATVKAPADGIVSQTGRLHVGQYMQEGTAALSLVETGDTWLEANFKETQLTHMVPGQSAEIVVDAYPGRMLKATVDSIGAATGAEFSLLPPQNATGNWVKVVQRLPVRLRLDDPAEAASLRSGMSATVTVDTGKRPLFDGRFDEWLSVLMPAAGDSQSGN